AGFGDPVLDDSLVRQRLAEGDPLVGSAAHQLESPLCHADGPHAVVDAPRAEPGLGDGEPLALTGDDVLGRNPDVVEDHLGVATVVPVGVAEDVHAALDVHTGGVHR